MPLANDIQDIKIIGAVMILLLGGFGCAAPVLAHAAGKRSAKVSYFLSFFQRVMLSLGAGVVIATALVHIIPDGLEALEAGGLGEEHDHHHHGGDDDHCPCDDDNSTDVNATSAALTVVASSSSPHPPAGRWHRLYAALRRSKRSKARRAAQRDALASHAAVKALLEGIAASVPSHHTGGSDGDAAVVSAADIVVSSSEWAKIKALWGEGREEGASPSLVGSSAVAVAKTSAGAIASTSSVASSAADDEDADDHDDDDDDDDDDEPYPWGFVFCLAGLAVTFVVESELHRLAGAAEGATMKAHLVEVGMATHSILVGIAFGTLSNIDTASSLAIALIFHQFCEGFAVGPIIQKGARSTLHGVILILIFAGSTPLGIAAGIFIYNYSDPKAQEGQLAQGVLSLVAAGLLLYVGCVEFLAELQHDDGTGNGSGHGHGHGGGIDHQHDSDEEGNDNESDNATSCEVKTTRYLSDASPTAANTTGALGEEASLLVNGNDNNNGAITITPKPTAYSPPPSGKKKDKKDFLARHPLLGRITTYTAFIMGCVIMSVVALWA